MALDALVATTLAEDRVVGVHLVAKLRRTAMVKRDKSNMTRSDLIERHRVSHNASRGQKVSVAKGSLHHHVPLQSDEISHDPVQEKEAPAYVVHEVLRTNGNATEEACQRSSSRRAVRCTRTS